MYCHDSRFQPSICSFGNIGPSARVNSRRLYIVGAVRTSDKRMQHTEGDAYYAPQTVVAFFKDQCHPLVKIDLIYSSYNMANNTFLIVLEGTTLKLSTSSVSVKNYRKDQGHFPLMCQLRNLRQFASVWTSNFRNFGGSVSQ